MSLQVFVQEAQEFQTGIDDLRYRRKASGKSGRSRVALTSDQQSPDIDTIHAILVVYGKALHHTLQVACHLSHSHAGRCSVNAIVWLSLLAC